MTHAILRTLAATAIVATVGAAPDLRQGEAVVWTQTQGASASGSSLVKTDPAGWNAGAIATRAIAASDGYAELIVSESTIQRMFGLSRGAPGQDYRNIDFAFYLNAGKLEIYEQGQSRGSFGKLTIGDRLRVGVADGAVQFSRNGTVLYTSALASTYPLLVAAALCSPGATLFSAVLAGELALTSDLTLWTWGASTRGELGDGTNVSRPSPTQVSDPGLLWKVALPTFSPTPGQFHMLADIARATVPGAPFGSCPSQNPTRC